MIMTMVLVIGPTSWGSQGPPIGASRGAPMGAPSPGPNKCNRGGHRGLKYNFRLHFLTGYDHPHPIGFIFWRPPWGPPWGAPLGAPPGAPWGPLWGPPGAPRGPPGGPLEALLAPGSLFVLAVAFFVCRS